MPKEYALRKLHSKDKCIFCGCDGISGLLIHYLLDELVGREEYLILHRFLIHLEDEWEWTLDGYIPDKDVIKEWFSNRSERIITTCWDYERTIQAVKDAGIKNVRIYKFCEYTYIEEELPF